MGKTEKILEWLKAIWFMNRNILKILDDQNEIKQKLEKIEETIKSPQYQVAELEKIKNTIDLLKENNEQEKKKLERGSQEEINKHKEKIKELAGVNEELIEYKDLVVKAIELIKQKDLQIKQLNNEILTLKPKVPASFQEALVTASTISLFDSDLGKAFLEARKRALE